MAVDKEKAFEIFVDLLQRDPTKDVKALADKALRILAEFDKHVDAVAAKAAPAKLED